MRRESDDNLDYCLHWYEAPMKAKGRGGMPMDVLFLWSEGAERRQTVHLRRLLLLYQQVPYAVVQQ